VTVAAASGDVMTETQRRVTGDVRATTAKRSRIDRVRTRLTARGGAGTMLLWTGSSRYSAALLFFLFPLLFLLDETYDFAFSPVLPGVVVLGLTWMVLPFILTELVNRRWRTLDEQRQNAKLNKWSGGGRTALIGGVIWWVSWLAWGT
jgi:hypothetical protein